MNIFKNVERNVVPAATNNTKEYRIIDKMSDSAASGAYLRKIYNTERAEQVEKEFDREDQFAEQKKRFEKVVLKSIQDSNAVLKINSINESAKTAILKDILFEVFYNSLVLDKDFLIKYENSLKYVIDQYIDENGGFALIENAIRSNDSILLKKIKTLCESVANKICKRKMKESKESDSRSDLSFDITDDEKDELDYGKSNIDIDRISELVKNKVLTVVQDEKHRQESESERMSEIEDEVKKTVDEPTSESIDEAFDKIVLSKPAVESGTLFNALLRSTYRDFITENVAINTANRDNIEKSHDNSETYDVDTDEDDIIDGEEIDAKDDEVETSEINPDLLYENATEVNMDLIMCEGIAQYTLMEMLYTLKLENYTYESISKLTEKLLNPVLEASSKKSKKSKKGNNFIKIRSEFFKSFNNLLNLKNIDKSKKELESFKEKCSKNPDDLAYFNQCVTSAMKELKSAKEKNPKFTDSYDATLSWLKELGKK